MGKSKAKRRVLIADDMSPLAQECFKQAGIEVDVKTGLDKQGLGSIIGGYDGLVVRSATKVTSKTPDGKTTIESGSRWIATTTREGQQWKISNLIQVI